MPNKKSITFIERVRLFIILLLSISGYVPKHATKIRTIAILSSFTFYIYLILSQSNNFKLALIYFLVSETLYIGFLTLVLRKDGYRHWFIKRNGAKKGYLIYEGILGFLFLNNAASIGYMASSTPGNIFYFISKEFLFMAAALMFLGGFIIKIWATKVVSVDIYYWKDMFLGRKISKFAITGPYKYFSNPMYGIGQLQAYAIAIFYGSIFGLVTAILNQSLIFSFYYLVEKKFIKRIYQKRD